MCCSVLCCVVVCVVVLVVVLNYITAPRVLLWSAVTATCALPGLMEPQALMAKTYDGQIVEYYPTGTEWYAL